MYFSAKRVYILYENSKQNGILKCKHSDILKMFYWNKFLETKHFTIFSKLLQSYVFWHNSIVIFQDK